MRFTLKVPNFVGKYFFMKPRKAIYLITFLLITVFAWSCEDKEQTLESKAENPDITASLKTDSLAPCISECLMSLQNEEISPEEEAHLIMMREEELMAQEVYQYLYSLYNVPVFNNISRSENTHTLTIKVLLDKYNIADPALGHEMGVFHDQEIQELYNNLTEQGSQSFLDALIVGITIEDLDIYDLEICLEDVDNTDIGLVFSNLSRGSRNHMRAFNGHLENQGFTYDPQYISQVYFDDIVNSPWETGNGICQSCHLVKRTKGDPAGIE